jgi:hypothetical protein
MASLADSAECQGVQRADVLTRDVLGAGADLGRGGAGERTDRDVLSAVLFGGALTLARQELGLSAA